MFHSYYRPNWKDWDAVWNAQPFELDRVADPTVDHSFYAAPFRLRLTSPYLSIFHKGRTIQQGTTITFKGYENDNGRHVVEWCQWIDEHEAYLKVVGYDSTGQGYAYWDPDFPTFILIVPVCIVDVPIPFPILPYMHLDEETLEEEERNRKICWACR
jgi:hypothetical protein